MTYNQKETHIVDITLKAWKLVVKLTPQRSPGKKKNLFLFASVAQGRLVTTSSNTGCLINLWRGIRMKMIPQEFSPIFFLFHPDH